MPDKIDVDALIDRLRAAWRSGTEHEAADALAALKADGDALRADLERAREALLGLMHAYEAIGGQTAPGTWYSHAAAALSPAPAPVTPPLEEGQSKGGRMPFPSGVRERPEPPASISDTLRSVFTEVASWPQGKMDAIARCVASHVATLQRETPAPTPYEPSDVEIEAAAATFSLALAKRTDGPGMVMMHEARDALIAAHKARRA